MLLPTARLLKWPNETAPADFGHTAVGLDGQGILQDVPFETAGQSPSHRLLERGKSGGIQAHPGSGSQLQAPCPTGVHWCQQGNLAPGISRELLSL